MKSSVGSILISFIFSFVFYFHSLSLENEKVKTNPVSNSKPEANQIPVAKNDTFLILNNCLVTIKQFADDLTKNDIIPENTTVKIAFAFAPQKGILSVGTNGRFLYLPEENFLGEVSFRYRLCNALNDSLFSDAEVVIQIKYDYDCDGIPDDLDLDDDNDGIPDVDEGPEDLDSDNDNVPNYLDIDSDNDGIPDNVEWQCENEYLSPSQLDENKNGWDDAYDAILSGKFHQAEDTDEDGIPDFLDLDSDDDAISDLIEGNDLDFDEISDKVLLLIDKDKDGLDDVFDTILCWSLGCNTIGSNVETPDHDKNGIRDWRDKKSAPISIDPGNEPALSIIDTIFSLYPNPAVEYIQIHVPYFNEEESNSVQLLTLDGKTELVQTIESSPYRIDLNQISSGLKIIAVRTPLGVFTEKIIIRK